MIKKEEEKCAICDSYNSVKDGVCDSCGYYFRDTDN